MNVSSVFFSAGEQKANADADTPTVSFSGLKAVFLSDDEKFFICVFEEKQPLPKNNMDEQSTGSSAMHLAKTKSMWNLSSNQLVLKPFKEIVAPR